MIYINNEREIISTDNKLIRHKTRKVPFSYGRALQNETADDYEEITREEVNAASRKAKFDADYKAKVIELVRAKYDMDDEIAINRQRDTKPEEFAEYTDFVESCKVQAKEFLLARI